MEQIAVIKITTERNGNQIHRNMTLPKNIWEQIVSGEAIERNVTWQLRKIEPVVMKETKIIQENIKEVELIGKTEEDIFEEDFAEEKIPEKRVYKKRK